MNRNEEGENEMIGNYKKGRDEKLVENKIIRDEQERKEEWNEWKLKEVQINSWQKRMIIEMNRNEKVKWGTREVELQVGSVKQAW